MIICPDCELEVEKLNRDGICKQCAIRVSNVKYQNKKNGTNNPYVKLKDIKGTKEYNRAVGRRLAAAERRGDNIKSQSKSKPAVTVTKTTYKVQPNVEELKNKYYAEVVSDVNAAFKKNNISQNYLSYKNMDEFVETLFSILQEDNFIVEAKKADSVFYDLKIDYDHLLENTSFEDIEEMQRCNFLLKILLDLRRPTKEILDYYYVIDPVISYLKMDKKLIDLLDEARIKLKQKADNHKDYGYYVRESELVSQEDFVLGQREEKYKLFDCTVWCYNLHGNPNKTLFRANGGVKAKNITEAKLKFKAFLKEKFYSVTYKESDMTIEEVTLEELNKRTKECL